MTAGQAKAVRPVKAFFGRLAVQIVISGSAMAAIHFGMGLAPELAPWFGWEAPVVASVAAPPALRSVVFVTQAPVMSFPAPFALGSAPALHAAADFPVPEAAPERPLRTASLDTPRTSPKGVQRFDACQPACPSRDPLVHPAKATIAHAAPVADRSTDYPEVLDDGLNEGSDSLLAVPGRAINAAARTAKGAWNKVGSLSPFD